MALGTSHWLFISLLLLIKVVLAQANNGGEDTALYVSLTVVMVLIIILLAAIIFFMFKYGLDLCSLMKLFRTNFVDIVLCRLKKEDLYNKGSRDPGGRIYEDGDTLDELPPPRSLKTSRDDGWIPTESTLDLNALVHSSSDDDDSDDEDQLDANAEPTKPTPVIVVDDFIANYGAKCVDQGRLRKEYDLLTMWSKLITTSKSHAKLEKNKAKNRYYDIIPYNYNRVPLYDVEGLKGNQEYKNLNKKDRKKMGYINASFIHEYGSDRIKYIAAQGPLRRTIRDFWDMVWQEGSGVIVMLTSLREQGKVKCEQYWPKNKGDILDFGEIKITLEVSQCYAFYDYRVVVLEKGSEKRPVHHYLYHHWPDKEAPEMVVPVLDLYHKVFKSDHVLKNPVVIHCSAGVGRTGTFISIDYLLKQAAQTGQVDVARCVYELRRQRVSMVQKVSQYMFVYEAIHEALEARQTMVSASLFREWYDNAKIKEPSIIKKHYEMIKAKCPVPIEESEGHRPENMNKNRSKDIIPADFKRPFLITYMKDRNNYVNAVYVDTFLETDCIIVSQCPMEHTIEDFWRLVYDRNCAAILLLEPVDESYPVYWPKDNEEKKYANTLTVTGYKDKKTSTEAISVYSYTVILLQQPDYVVDVKLLQLNTWPRGDVIPPEKLDLVDLMNFWKKYKRQSSIIQCFDGSEKSGLFCACTYIVDQIQTDHQVDIYHACRMITATRPSFIMNEEQYVFLHEFAEEFIDSFGDYSNFAKPGISIAPRKGRSSSLKNRLSFQYSKKRDPPKVIDDTERSNKNSMKDDSPLRKFRSSHKSSRHSSPVITSSRQAEELDSSIQRKSLDTILGPTPSDQNTDKDVYIDMAQVRTRDNAGQNNGSTHNQRISMSKV